MDAAPPIASFMMAMLIDGGPVNAAVMRKNVMSIPKPVRHLIQFSLFFGLSIILVLLSSQLRPMLLAVISMVLAVSLAYIGAFVFSMVCVDSLDHWLRRRTRDPIWLMTNEGKEWLNSEQGKEWQRNICDRITNRST